MAAGRSTAATAATVRDLMVAGGAAAAREPRPRSSGVQVAGKTGTAEVADAEPHAWFAGFAPADDPQVVVAVLVENAGTGGSVAAPIARAGHRRGPGSLMEQSLR